MEKTGNRIAVFLHNVSIKYEKTCLLWVGDREKVYYILVVITFIFKALHFTDAYKDLVDALFYSTNMITMLSTAMQKANTQ